MELTENQDLPYPTDNDPGDGALDLQLLAEAMNARLVAQFANYRKVVNKEVKVSIMNTDATTGFTNNFLVALNDPAFFTWTTLIDTTGGAQPINPFDLSGFVGGGVYRAGMFIKSQPTGTADLNTERDVSLNVQIALDATTPSTFQTQILAATSYEANNGSTLQIVDSEIFLPFPGRFPFVTSGSFITPNFFHTNTSSSVLIQATSLAWLLRVGDLDG